MTIAEAREKCKIFIGDRIPRDVFIISILILASLFSFGLGYLAGLDAMSSKGQGSKIIIEEPSITTTSGQVIASKTGTKYYLPSCASASRISEENKIWFASVELAKTAGYTPAANCKFE